jgi:hypothetical protein
LHRDLPRECDLAVPEPAIIGFDLERQISGTAMNANLAHMHSLPSVAHMPLLSLGEASC